MKFFVTVLVAATAVLAQQQDSNQGPNLSNGPSAVSNPNINNGEQFQGSFVDGSRSGGNQVGPGGSVDGSFNHQASNSAIMDSNFVNPSQNSLSGNKGDTANGEGNSIGDVFGAGAFFKRQGGPGEMAGMMNGPANMGEMGNLGQPPSAPPVGKRADKPANAASVNAPPPKGAAGKVDTPKKPDNADNTGKRVNGSPSGANKRDAVLNNFGGHPAEAGLVHPPPAPPTPAPHVLAPAPPPHPVAPPPIPGHINDNHQDGTIVQNQA
ncbi:hypothetical protein EV178_005772 [Coemansia sp. RSA 1646]|nr:hypothetical protein EV178_005772 [Coemansia sp. RSA 1646]